MKNEYKNGQPVSVIYRGVDRSGYIYICYDEYNGGHVLYASGKYHLFNTVELSKIKPRISRK